MEFDPRENDAKLLERGVFYEDELELCVPVSKTSPFPKPIHCCNYRRCPTFTMRREGFTKPMRASPSAIPCLSCYAECDSLHKHGWLKIKKSELFAERGAAVIGSSRS